MKIIQLILIIGTIFSLGLYLRFFRSVLRDRLIAVVLFCTAIICIVVPDATTSIANLIGVGRGTDLIVYISVITALFLFLLLYSRLQKIERAHTELIRHLAISNPTAPKN